MENEKDVKYMHHNVGRFVLLARMVTDGDSRKFQLYKKGSGWADDAYAIGMFLGEEDGERITEKEAEEDIKKIENK